MTAPSTVLIGRSFSRSIRRGLVLRSIGYSLAPILAVPLGKTRFCALRALTTSCWERFCASSALGSRSTGDDPLLAAVRIRNPHAGHADESDADRVHGDVEDLLLGKSLAADAIL